jgi:hypothetical protein
MVYQLFDPEYINLSGQKLQLAKDKVREYRKKIPIAAGAVRPAVPVIAAIAVPLPHKAYLQTRR